MYFQGFKAGLTRWEVDHLPLGRVLDQIACYQIAECGDKEKSRRARSGDLFEQMKQLGGG